MIELYMPFLLENELVVAVDVICEYPSNTLNKVLWQYPSKDSDFIEYTNAIIDIVALILNITELNKGAKGTITSNDIMDGKVEGTVVKKLKDAGKELETDVDIDRGI